MNNSALHTSTDNLYYKIELDSRYAWHLYTIATTPKSYIHNVFQNNSNVEIYIVTTKLLMLTSVTHSKSKQSHMCT